RVRVFCPGCATIVLVRPGRRGSGLQNPLGAPRVVSGALKGCSPRHWYEQPVLILHHNGLAGRAILVLLELKLAQVVVRALAAVRLDALQILPEPERPMPRRRPRDTRPGCDALEARM